MAQRLAAVLVWAILCGAVPAKGEELTGRISPIVESWREDASLRGVTAIGRETAMAVGDHGVLWRTTNGGQSWERVETGTTASLAMLLAPTDKFLIAVGGGREPYSTQSSGVLLVSRDGGTTWTDRARHADGTRLPRLHGAYFASPTEGIVWGEPSVLGGPWAGSGVFRTEDGGEIWQPVPVPSRTGWQTAAFIDLEQGLVANRLGEARLVLGFASEPSRLDRLANRRLNDVRLERGGYGWLVGDNGTLLTTENSGISWQAPSTLPAVVRRAVDFHAVAFRDDVVLAAGQPGSAIWQSQDRGKSWTAIKTPITTPIYDLSLTTGGVGYAVGALGVILKTSDGGATWNLQQGGARRSAAVVIAPRESDVPWAALADYAGEQGYRIPVLVVAATGESDRTEVAAPRVGAAGADVAARLTLGLPDLERDAARLIAHWDATSEGTWRRQLVSTLVRDLRSWRPSVVIGGRVRPDDAISLLLDEAISTACTDAGDSTLHSDLADQLYLPAWSPVRRFVVAGEHVAAGGATVTLDGSRFLPRLGLSNDAWLRQVLAEGVSRASPIAASGVTAGGSSELRTTGLKPTNSIGFVLKATTAQNETSRVDAPTDLFAGLRITPDSPARRPLPPVTGDHLETAERSARNLRTVESFLARSLDDRRISDQLLAQLPELTRDLPADQAAAVLSGISRQYREGQRWDAAEQVCLEMLRRYPTEAATRIELASQITLWSSSEWAWRHVRNANIVAGRSVGAPGGATSSQIVQVSGRQANSGDTQSRSELVNAEAARTAQAEAGRVTLRRNVNERLEQRLRLAEQAAEELARQAPAMAAGPEVQFGLASAMRSLGRTTTSNEIYRRFGGHPGNNPWTRAARMEIWLAAPTDEPALPLKSVYPATARPRLDGLLSDPCWEAAEEITLDSAGQTPLLLLVSRDDNYLYLAGSATRPTAVSEAAPLAKARQHDADVEGFDRVTLVIDVDRDYNLGWEWTIDERGQTRDACCGDLAWNPKYHLAAASDERTWRFEMAIPWDELSPVAPSDRSKIAFRACRTIPGVGWQTWPASTSAGPVAAPFGLLSFDD